ncbi:calcium uptake protein 3, mitochondrial-like isoform X4 [Mya arenaria]|uniref:calcium uptake protein 3, mitochondrial-like isoform X4 n=1 Tax=Mya arenaria TaxID=6604 RepID=UPI0022E65433|nr:calcium uptake protein 3, mitochondrial-like isoform X4 [Mya arenaria]
MAASLTRKTLTCSRNFRLNCRQLHTFRASKAQIGKTLAISVPCTGFIAWQTWRLYRQSGDLVPTVHAAQESETRTGPALTFREVRFQQFASVQYEGVIYMTPQDFLESVTEDVPRHTNNGSSARIGRSKLSKDEVEKWLYSTPNRRRGSKSLFRSMHNKGLISYTEYLFLLCVLTKPQSGFRIAFNMFDTDGNQIVDKKEFLVLESLFGKPVESGKGAEKKSDSSEERKFTVDGREIGSVMPIQDTTLLVHFFGRRGNDVLKYEDFHKFMENLQTEVIELEFLEFSKGMQTISEEDFARILLRYTNLDKTDIGECLQRVRSNTPEEKGISFDEFRQFSQFMNSLDDFTIAMNMYTYAQQPVSKEEFQRAVMICTGSTLNAHIVDTLFNIFDVDGDQHLSYKEFISIMKDRKYRGNRSHLQPTPRTWDAFKVCVKSEMKSYV